MTHLVVHFFKNHQKLLVGLCIALCLVLTSASVSLVYAADGTYSPLAPLPVDQELANALKDTNEVNSFVQTAFKTTIGLSAALAVIMMIVGGLQYMSTDAYSGKSEGIKKLQSALLGFLLVICAYLILRTINPNLVEFNAGFSLSQAPATPAPGTPAAPAPKQKVCTATVTHRLSGQLFASDASAGSNSRGCDSKKTYWEKQKFTTVGTAPGGAGRNGCYQDTATGNYCLDIFAGSATGYVKTDCSAGKDYKVCQKKNTYWAGERAFNASCNCEMK